MAGMRKAVMFVLGAALIVAAVSISAPAQVQPLTADRSGAEVLPDSTIFFFEMRDIRATEMRSRENAMRKIFADPQVKEYLGPISENLKTALGQLDQMLQANIDMSLNDITRALNGRLTIAVTDLSVMPAPNVKVVLMLTPTDTAHMKGLLDKVMPQDLLDMAETRTVSGVEMRQVGQGAESFSWALAANTLILGMGDGSVAGVLNTMAQPNRTLKNNQIFAPVYQQVGEYDRDWIFYLNLESPLMMAQVLGGAEAANVINHLGLNSMKGLAIAGRLQGDTVEDIFYLHMPGEAQGIGKLLSAQPVDMNLLGVVPADAYQFSLGRLNIAPLYDFIIGAVQHFDADTHAEMMQAIQEFEGEMGVNIRNDFIASLGEEIISYELAKPAAQLLEKMRAADDEAEKEMLMNLTNYGYSIYMMTVKDRARLTNSADKLTDALLVQIKAQGGGDQPWVEEGFEGMGGGIDMEKLQFARETYQGISIKYLTGFPVEELTPAYAVTDRFLIVSGSKDTIRKAIDMQAAGGAGSIVNTPLWADARNRIPQNSAGFSVGDMAKGVDILPVAMQRLFTGQMGMMFGEMGAQYAEKDPAPMLEAVKRQRAVSVMSYHTVPGQGIAVVGRSPVGTSSLAPVGVIGGAGLGAYYTYMMMQAFQGGGDMMVQPPAGGDWDF